MSAWWYVAAAVLTVGTAALVVLAAMVVTAADDLASAGQKLTELRNQLTGLASPVPRLEAVRVSPVRRQLTRAQQPWRELRQASRRTST